MAEEAVAGRKGHGIEMGTIEKKKMSTELGKEVKNDKIFLHLKERPPASQSYCSVMGSV